MRRGVVYACSHARWLSETVDSAVSCRHHMPDLVRQLYVERGLHDANAAELNSHFTEIIVLDQVGHFHRPRFEALLTTNLEEALFVDGDTLFISPVYELFQLLDHFEIALALAPQYFSPRAVKLDLYRHLPSVSDAQPEWNGGVIVARITDAFRNMVRQWSKLFAVCQERGFGMDQASLRSALSTSRLRVATLPVNYNFRANVPQAVAGPVKILHAHGDLTRIAGYINATNGIRVYKPTTDEIYGFQPKDYTPSR